MEQATWYDVLLTPWRVAPHPNQSVKRVTVKEAVSLLLDGRFFDYTRLAESDPSLPSLGAGEEARSRSLDRSVLRALILAITGGSDAGAEFFRLALSGKPAPVKVFAAIQGSISYADQENHAVGIQSLNSLLDRLDTAQDPLGATLLLLQRSLREADLGLWQDALRSTDQAISLLSGNDKEPESSLLQIAELNAWLYRSRLDIFAEGFPGLKRLPLTDLLSRPATKEASALNAYLKRRFESLVVDPYGQSTTWAAQDLVETGLWVSLMLAEGRGDHGGARSARISLARYQLIEATDGASKEIAEPLRMLIRSRDDKAVTAAARRFLQQGPLEPLREATVKAAEGNWNTANAKSNLALLHETGDLLPGSARLPLAQRLLDLGVRVPRTSPESRLLELYGHEPFETLSEIILFSDQETQMTVATRLIDIHPPTNELVKRALGSVLHNLDWRLITSEVQSRWRDYALRLAEDENNRELALTVLGQLAQKNDSDAGKALVDIFHRRPTLLAAATIIDSDTPLTQRVAKAIRDLCIRQLNKITDDARKGSFGWGGISAPLLLTVTLYKAPHRDDWARLTTFLTDKDVARGDKEPALEAIARRGGELPTEVANRLRQAKNEMLTSNEKSFFGRPRPNAAALRMLLSIEALDRVEALAAITDLLGSGDPIRRIEGCRTLPFVRHLLEEDLVTTMGLNLSRDSDSVVRANAAHFLATLLANRESGLHTLIEERVLSLIAEPGISVPHAVLVGLTDTGSSITEALSDLVEEIRNFHPSQRIRMAALSVFEGSNNRSVVKQSKT